VTVEKQIADLDRKVMPTGALQCSSATLHDSTSPVDVAKTLIEDGIRRAIREGHLTPEDVNAVRGKK
jgi:hypothetical protein